jgi:hypothetical protein
MSDTLQLVVDHNTQLDRNANQMSDTLQLVVVAPINVTCDTPIGVACL